MSSLSPANGSEEKVYKVQVLKLVQYVESHGRWFNFAFYKKMWPSNSAFENAGGRNLNKSIFKSLNHRGVAREGGMLNLGIDRRINRKKVRSLID